MTPRLDAEPALALAARLLRRSDAPVMLVDGRSGSGKTSFADALVAATGASVLRIDDLYPGWDGLAAGADATVRLLLARRAGAPPVARRWDWRAGTPGAPVVVPPGPLVVEGCGALSRASAPLARLRIWLELPDDERRRRALARDGATFAPHWERWARQERRLIARDDPRRLADVLVASRAQPPLGRGSIAWAA